MPKLPRYTPQRETAKTGKKKAAKNPADSTGIAVDAMRAAEHQSAIIIAASADLPLPESYFYGVYFSKQIFDDTYRAMKLQPTYIGRERYIRPSDLRKIIDSRARTSLVVQTDNLRTTKTQ